MLSVHGHSNTLEVIITFDGVAISNLESDLISNRVLHLRESTEPSDVVPPAAEGSIGLPGAVPDRSASQGADLDDIVIEVDE